MNISTKYNIGQKVIPIHYQKSLWEVTSPVTVTRILIETGNELDGDIRYQFVEYFISRPEKLLFADVESAERECDKRNIIQELKK